MKSTVATTSIFIDLRRILIKIFGSAAIMLRVFCNPIVGLFEIWKTW